MPKIWGDTVATLASQSYLEKNNLSMVEALDGWNKKDNKHPLSIELSKTINCT